MPIAIRPLPVFSSQLPVRGYQVSSFLIHTSQFSSALSVIAMPGIMRLNGVMKFALPCVLLMAFCFSGCETASTFVADMKAFLLGPYEATPSQIAIAQRRGDEAMKKLPADQPKPRYIAVRTANPNAEQRREIRKEAKKSGGRYGGSASGVVYCLMTYDTTQQKVVGTECYAVSRLPYDGEQFTFETYNMTYVSTES